MPTTKTSSDARWLKATLVREQIPLKHHHWLFDRASLTDKLVARADGDFAVVVLDQRIRRPLFSETRELGLSSLHHAVVREVALIGKGVPWVYARTIIPLISLGGPLRRLRYLGNRSLGSALFADPHLKRGDLQVAKIGSEYLPNYPILDNYSPAWGRRSVFSLKGKSLLVTEVFLDSLWNNG